jgi:hypothetical protein
MDIKRWGVEHLFFASADPASVNVILKLTVAVAMIPDPPWVTVRVPLES